ncbi:hypothetical protein [Burkholderia pseudomallei]|uniref:hypothetical protein n=1 Tax=Burkholderia pseudomallei TaxID=28450 RepID=UPI00117772EC|nr:hypothetical protein [Burkholderia pseudomallei]
MNNDVYRAIHRRIVDKPGIYGATKAEQQAAFRARRTALKILEKAATFPDFDEWGLEAAFKQHGMQLVRSTQGRTLVAYGDGLEVRKAIIKALRAYLRPRRSEHRLQYVRDRNAARPTRKKAWAEAHARLVERGVDLAQAGEVVEALREAERA